MGVPMIAAYVSEDKRFTITVTRSNAENGRMVGLYNDKHSPIGEFVDSEHNKGYAWFNNKQLGRDGVAPFVVTFSTFKRPYGRPYTINYVWNGAYTTNNTMLLTGVRAYVTELGKVKSVCLGTQTFSH